METSVNSDWRDPSDSEKEIIAEWRRQDIRARRRFIYMGLICLVVTVLLVIFMPSIINIGKYVSFILQIAGVILILFEIIFIVVSSDLHRKKRFLRGDYQILDSVVMSKRMENSIQSMLELKTASGKSVEIILDDYECKTITPGTSGFLFRYGKNATEKIDNTTKFIPVREAGTQDDGTADQSSGCDWRSPNASEADRITAWAHEIIRSNRLARTRLVAVLGLLQIVFLIMLFIGKNDDFFITALINFTITTFMQAWLCFPHLLLKKQLSTRNYLILDVIVVSKTVSQTVSPRDPRYHSEYHIQVKTPSRKIMKVKVVMAVYYAITENSPGYLVHYGNKKPTDKGKDKDFYPAKPVEE